MTYALHWIKLFEYQSSLCQGLPIYGYLKLIFKPNFLNHWNKLKCKFPPFLCRSRQISILAKLGPSNGPRVIEFRVFASACFALPRMYTGTPWQPIGSSFWLASINRCTGDPRGVHSVWSKARFDPHFNHETGWFQCPPFFHRPPSYQVRFCNYFKPLYSTLFPFLS